MKVSDYYYTSSDELSVANYVQATGPAQVFVGASAWHTYISNETMRIGSLLEYVRLLLT